MAPQIKSKGSSSAPIIVPFLKWAGGKRWLADRLAELASPISGKYIEPFLGSAAAYFSIRPAKALLSDTNPELIITYEAIRSNPQRIEDLLTSHQRNHSPEYYYRMRDYRPRCEFRRAARFIYLNRTCWNGLYRVNLDGRFNVPIGSKKNVLMPSDDWHLIARVLGSAQLVCCDFEATIDQASAGDFVFADPPYTVKHNHNGFIKYNNSLFSWTDQIRLRDALLRAKKRGARIVVTNADHQSLRDMYAKDFLLESMTRASVLAASAAYRGRYEELLIRA